MTYRERVIRIDLDDLGDGCYVVIRNPLLEPPTPIEEVTSTDDEQEIERRGRLRAARLILEWRLYDVDDASPDPAVLPLPRDDLSVFDKVPLVVTRRIWEATRAAQSPLQSGSEANGSASTEPTTGSPVTSSTPPAQP